MANEAHTRTLRTQLRFGEAPRWRNGRLFYSDFYRHAVFSMAPDGSDERLEVDVPNQPSGLGWLPDGSLLVVSMTDRRVLRVSPRGELSVHADISTHCGYWANDMVVSSEGFAYIGNFGFDLDAFLEEHGAEALYREPGPPTTNLVVLAPNGEIIQVVDDLCFPNGMVLSEDGQTLIVAETMRCRLSAFRVGPDGTLSSRRTFAQLDGIAADGICGDVEGHIWVADARRRHAVRVGEGGVITDEVVTSGRCYACALGGDDGKTLYLVTGVTSAKGEAATSANGCIEATRVDVAGLGFA